MNLILLIILIILLLGAAPRGRIAATGVIILVAVWAWFW